MSSLATITLSAIVYHRRLAFQIGLSKFAIYVNQNIVHAHIRGPLFWPNYETLSISRFIMALWLLCLVDQITVVLLPDSALV